jgi:acetolactate decarboxylase
VAALEAALDKLIVHKDAFYAIRIDGVFQQIKVRCPPKQQKPYPALADALKNQVFFEYQDIKGTVVGLWSPAYVGEVNTAGYNLHFISADHTKGGHLVEGALTEARVSLDETRSFDMVLSP